MEYVPPLMETKGPDQVKPPKILLLLFSNRKAMRWQALLMEKAGHKPPLSRKDGLVILLKFCVYGTSNRVESGHRLEQEARRNVELMRLAGRL